MMTRKSDNCKDGVSKSNDGVCEVNNMLQNMGVGDEDVSMCANCGKEGAKNICNKCKQVKYCNATCKKKHRHKHKKDCEEHVRVAAEHAAKLHDIELFKQPPPQLGDCPICFLRMPTIETGYRYMPCCGKVICCGCIHTPVFDDQGNEVDNEKCPFCRTQFPTSEEEAVKWLNQLVKKDDPIAIHNIGNYYRDGRNGYPKDHTKALELWHRAGELGYPEAYTSIGYSYDHGIGVEVDETKATDYYERAAMGGSESARHNLAATEVRAGKMNRALKHLMIAVRVGWYDSLDTIKQMYSKGYTTKEAYMKALQSYQAYLSEIKSDQRDKAAAAHDGNRYY